MAGIDTKAMRFSRSHGSFTLHFDAAQNYSLAADRPWTVTLHSGPGRAWSGFTAWEALDAAESELAGQHRDPDS